jgi:hypothetical protein
MRFIPYGPFEVPVTDGAVDSSQLKKWWRDIDFDGKHTNLPAAYGCYIFALHIGSKLVPWYVGRTRASFKGEILTGHKLWILEEVLKSNKRGKLVVIFLARTTSNGKLRRGDRRSATPEVEFLEDALIGACLARNPDLMNRSQTSYLRKLTVPGFLNDEGIRRTASARIIAQIVGR